MMVDYDDEEGDLYIRFKEVEYTEGEPTDDGLVIFHYSGNKIAALEIMDVTALITKGLQRSEVGYRKAQW